MESVRLANAFGDESNEEEEEEDDDVMDRFLREIGKES